MDTLAVLVLGDDGGTTDALRTLGFEVTRADGFEGDAGTSVDGDASAFDCVVVRPAGSPADALQSATFDAPVVLVGGDPTDAAAALDAGAAAFVSAVNATDPAVLGARVRAAVADSETTSLREEREALAAERSRERGLLNAIFETVPAHLFVKDREARHLRVSEAYVDEIDRFLGNTDYEVLPVEESRATYEDDLRIMETGEPIFDKEEPIVSAETTTFSMESLLERHGEVRGIETGKWVLTSKVPWRDADGEVVGLVGFAIDITDRKADKRRLERQNERLEEFAGIVSHDLRNPLNVARGYLELLETTVEDEAARSHLERIESAHRRMDELIEDVLALARQGEVVDEPTPTRVGDAARRAWRSTPSDGATLDVDAVGESTVEADAERLRALFENLFRNAVEHAAPDEDPVAVTVGTTDRGFFVADDGPGVPDSERESVFEAGHTSSPDGNGFGLAIVARIAEAHGWSVTLTESEAGGARFEFDVRRSGEAFDGSDGTFDGAGGPGADRREGAGDGERAGR